VPRFGRDLMTKLGRSGHVRHFYCITHSLLF
jgi:hypothetical protein